MKRRKLKRHVKLIICLLTSILFVSYYAWYISDLKARREVIEEVDIKPLVEESTQIIEVFGSDVELTRTVDVYFTNYHLGDGSSGTTTASGLQIKDFEVNEDSMYTYDGKVVVATANMTRLPRGIAEGYKSHELYDEFTIRLHDKEYQAIVLDVCGACYFMEGEFLQRYDIFTTKNWVGKVLGQLIINKEDTK